jgi:hypothetical protein
MMVTTAPSDQFPNHVNRTSDSSCARGWAESYIDFPTAVLLKQGLRNVTRVRKLRRSAESLTGSDDGP